MTAQLKQLIMDRGFPSSYDRSIAGKVTATIEKLFKDTSTNGLHVEPIQNCADKRVRTARVDEFQRMVLFDLGHWMLLYGVYPHDRVYVVAAKAYARVNPTSGAAEIRQAEGSDGNAKERYTDSELKALVEARAAELLAERQSTDGESPAPAVEEAAPEPSAPSGNPLAGYTAEQLTDQLGIDGPVAEYAVGAPSEEELLTVLGRVGG